MITWIKWAIIIFVILVILIFLIKIFSGRRDTLDSRISGVRSSFDKVCAKIKHLIGC